MPPDDPKLPFVRDINRERAWIEDQARRNADDGPAPSCLPGILIWLGVLQVMLAGLKYGVVAWSWWIICAPALVAAVILLTIAAGWLLLRLAATVVMAPRHRRRP